MTGSKRSSKGVMSLWVSGREGVDGNQHPKGAKALRKATIDDNLSV